MSNQLMMCNICNKKFMFEDLLFHSNKCRIGFQDLHQKLWHGKEPYNFKKDDSDLYQLEELNLLVKEDTNSLRQIRDVGKTFNRIPDWFGKQENSNSKALCTWCQNMVS